MASNVSFACWQAIKRGGRLSIDLPRNGIDTDVAVRFRRVVLRLSRLLNDSATDEGLSPTQASVLALAAHRGPVPLGELAAAEHLNPTMLSRVIGKLDGDGLVRRLPNPEDQRAALVEATDAGHVVARRIRTSRTAAVMTVIDRLEPEAADALVAALPVLEDLVEGWDSV